MNKERRPRTAEEYETALEWVWFLRSNDMIPLDVSELILEVLIAAKFETKKREKDK